MQQQRDLNVQVKPLNVSSGMKIVGEGSFQQKYSRDDNAFYPSYSSIMPLLVTVVVNIQDPDGIVANGPAVLDRIDWYLNEYKPINKIANTSADYEITTSNGINVLKIKRNTPVGEPIFLIGEAFYTNLKTGKQESRIEQHLLSTIYYEATMLSLMAGSPTEVIVDPTKTSDWHIALKAILKSGEINLKEENACYWWYVVDGQYTRLITTSDTWLISSIKPDGTYPSTLVVDASRFKNLKLECRASYRGAADAVPSSPTNASLLLGYNIRVTLPVLQGVKQVPIAGAYISVQDINTNNPVKSRCEITAGGKIIDSPERFYNITWKATNKNGTSFVLGYGELVETTVKALGITIDNPVSIEPIVIPKIGSWNVEGSIYNGMSASPVIQFGVNQIADKLGAYLVKSDGIDVQIVGKLMNNNWMRFEDGSLAPTIINSAAEDKGYNIMYGWDKKIHTIENAKIGDEQVALFSEKPFEYNKVQSRAIPPTLICPGLPALVDGKLRSLYFKYRAGTEGGDGKLGINYFNKGDRTYPKTLLNQLSTNDYSVAHNSDITKTIPFSPLMDWNLLNITNALMNKFGTVYLHDPNKFGAGISSNIGSSPSAWEKSTMVRFKIGAATEWTYQSLTYTPAFCIDSAGTKTNWCDMISCYYPRMKCLEIQMALSFASENNIQEGVSFSFDGESFKYYNVPGTKTLLEGEMNAILIKEVALSFKAFDASGAEVQVSAELHLQTSSVYGIDLVSADVFQYAGAGIEHVAVITSAADGDNPNNELKFYLCTEQDKLSLDKTVVSTGRFPFENTYSLVHTGVMIAGFYTDLVRGTRVGATRKGGISDNSAYNNVCNYSGGKVGDNIRMMHLVRSYGYWHVASARSLTANSSLANAHAACAGGFQVRLPEGTLSAAAKAKRE